MAMGHVSRLGLLGGTFDPPHAAHLRLAAVAGAALVLDEVLFVPAGNPWRKRDHMVTPAKQRFAMTSAAVQGQDWFSVSDMEMQRPGPTYTVDTLRALREQGHELIWFILGADALEDLPRWHEPREIIRLARLAVAARPGSEIDLDHIDKLVPGLVAAVDWLPVDLDTASASDIRKDVAAGRSVADRVPAAVCAYIEKHGLYRRER